MSNPELPEEERESAGFEVVDDDDLETFAMPTHPPKVSFRPPGSIGPHRRRKRMPVILLAFLLGLLIGRTLT